MRQSLFLAVLASSLVLCFSPAAEATVSLPALISDHMVLQRGSATLWGTAAPGESVQVAIGTVRGAAVADEHGKWLVKLAGLVASDQPADLEVAGTNHITVHDVLIGDAWLCSGQSNMEYALAGAHNATVELPKAKHPEIRFFLVAHRIAFTPADDVVGKWEVCTPMTIGRFSAVAYFFAVDVAAAEKCPVGMIGSYWGGTPAQAWTSIDALRATEPTKPLANEFVATRDHLADLKVTFEKGPLAAWQVDHDRWNAEVGAPYAAAMKQWTLDVAKDKASGKLPTSRPVPSRPEPREPKGPDTNQNLSSVLFNGMIAPLMNYSIKGVIWYQGESNSGMPVQYQTLFPAMISDWRSRWGEGDFPFLWVQLAAFHERRPEPVQSVLGWPGLREAQTMTLKLPNTGEALAIDIGEGPDIHPKNKLDVGRRLAIAARHVAYGEDIVAAGPTFDRMTVTANQAVISFKNVGGGLMIAAPPAIRLNAPPATMPARLLGFTVAGADKKFVWANAEVVGDTVVVSSTAVPAPIAVRYAWGDNPELDFYNREQLPAVPFRTDDWQTLTTAPPAK